MYRAPELACSARTHLVLYVAIPERRIQHARGKMRAGRVLLQLDLRIAKHLQVLQHRLQLLHLHC
jgi:hypothetical protein